MVPRHRLMQRKRLHLILRARMQIVGVDEIAAGSPHRWRSRLVIRGRLRRRLEIRNRANAIRQPRQLPEFVRQFRIDLLGNDPVAVHEIIGLVVVKLRIGAQKLGEFVKAPFEIHRRDDLVHLRANPFHFRQTDFVNLLRRQIRRGLPPNVERIRRGSIGQRRCRNVFAARGQVRRRYVVMQFLKRGRSRAGVNLLGLIGQPRTIGVGKCRSETP